MEIKDNIKASGALSIIVTDQFGNIKDFRQLKNLVVNTGFGFITSRMIGVSKNVMSHMGVGSNTTAAAAGNTDLGNLLGVRKALDSAVVTGVNSESVTYTCTFGAGEGTGAITEAGIFNAVVAGDMLCRTVFAVVNKGALDSMVVTWSITAAAA